MGHSSVARGPPAFVLLPDSRLFARRVRLPRVRRERREVDIARRGSVAAFRGVGVERTRLGLSVISRIPTGVTRREFAALDEPSELVQVQVVRVVEALGARELRVHRVARLTQPEHLRRVLQRAKHRGRHARGLFLGNHETARSTRVELRLHVDAADDAQRNGLARLAMTRF
jgi:acetolactate synthase regulatory subunit